MTQLPKKAFYIFLCGLLFAAAVLGHSFKPNDTDQLITALEAVCDGTAGTTPGTTYGPVADFDLSDLTHLNYLDIPNDCNAQLAGIGSWNTGTIESLEGTFEYAEAFNQDLNGWDISAVTSLIATFAGAQAFNQDLNGWDISGVTDLSATFVDAIAFKQKLCWDMGRVTIKESTLDGAPLSASIHQLGSDECADEWVCAATGTDCIRALTSSATSTVVSTVGALAAVLAAAAVLA